MVQKRPLILEPHVWRQQIRPPSNPSSFGGLLDLAIDIPSIISNAYELLQSNSSSMRVLSYVEPLVQKFRELDHWRNSYSKEIWSQSEALVYWSVPAQACNPADKDHEEKLFPFALIFSSIASASAWIFASSIMLDILDTILLLHSRNHNDSTVLQYENETLNSGITPSILDALLKNANRLSRLLCQSIEFCYRIENGTFGPQITCYAQATLLSYFAHHGHRRELDWCKAIPQMTGPGTSFGINLMQFRPTLDL